MKKNKIIFLILILILFSGYWFYYPGKAEILNTDMQDLDDSTSVRDSLIINPDSLPEEPTQSDSLTNIINVKDTTKTNKTTKIQRKIDDGDSTFSQPDSLLIIENHLQIEDSLQQEPDFIDSIQVEDTVKIDKDDLIDSLFIEVDTTHYIFVPYILDKDLSHPLIGKGDSSKIYKYLYKKALPKQTLEDFHFRNNIYKYSEEVNIERKNVLVKANFGKANYVTPFNLPLRYYFKIKSEQAFYNNFYSDLLEYSQQQQNKSSSEGIIPDIEFPKVRMPRAMRRFFGDNIGRLSVTGSQKITIGGQKTVKKPDPVTEGTKKSFLPDLTMKQELNLGIHGTIGEKIKVDVKQTSDESIFKKNKINIKYEGDEDDPIKLIEGGDTRLSLAGSDFISYSASSEDLFGLKGVFEFGKLRLKAIISQQEGKQASATATGSAMKDETEFRDMDFSRNKFFFINDPDSIFVGNIDTLLQQDWAYIDSLMPENNSVRVFLDDGLLESTDITGYDKDGNEYKLEELVPLQDFRVDYLESPFIIQMNTYIGNDYSVGVIYTNKSGKQYGRDVSGEPLQIKMIKKNYSDVSNQNLDEALWNYQIKYKYYLGGTNIESSGFDVSIYRELPNGAQVEGIIKEDSTFVPFIDILNLDTNGDDVVNGNDATVDLQDGIISFRMLEPFRERWFAQYDSIWFSQYYEHLGNNLIYEKLKPDPADYYPFYITVKMKKTSSQISLDHINIIRGSEKVYVDDELMKKGEDYTIDYFSGTVTLRGAVASDPNAKVKIDYEYEPIFSLDKKNMFGIRADYDFSNNANIGGTIIYESGSVREQHPKVGAEPQKIIVGDIDGSWNLNTPFLTDFVNMIPLIKTDAVSNISLSGEVAMNIPTPNATDNKEAYIDDMESVVKSYPFGINRTDWVYASFPVDIIDSTNIVDTLNKSNRGIFSWYNPHDKFRQEDVYADLPEDEGREFISVLECELKPNTNTQLPSWGGIMKCLGSIDCSEKKYLEITMKSNAIEGDSLYINLGFISEDYYPIFNPDEQLEQEDGIVNLDGELDLGEDVGLDEYPGQDPTPPKNHYHDGDSVGYKDDGNDDYHYSQGSDDYSGINGAEENGKLDGEDLDNNYRLDTKNAYIEYSIDLYDIDSEILMSEYNDWVFIRIPFQDSTYFKYKGSEKIDFSLIKSAKLWIKRDTRDSTNPLIVDFVDINLVGNKWIASPILDTTLHKPTNLDSSEIFEIATINNRSNQNYTPPPGSMTDEGSSLENKEVEQSIYLDCKKIKPDRYLYARQNFVDPMKLLMYKKIKFWVYGQRKDVGSRGSSAQETIIFRLGADTLNYYEYRQKIPVYDDFDEKMQRERWEEITIPFTEFTELKKNNIPDTTSTLRIVGNPNLENVKQVVVGLIRPDSLTSNYTGRIMFDDIRVADPFDEIGTASRISLNAKLADFIQISANYSSETPNFYSIGGKAGGGANSYNYSLDNKIFLDKFFPDNWGINLPLRVNYSFLESKPRFKPNSDVKLTTQAEKDSFKTYNEDRLISFNFSKNKKSSNPFIHYIFDNISFSGRVKTMVSLSPTRKDSMREYSASCNYNIRFSKDNSLGVFKGFKFYFLPQSISCDLSYNSQTQNKWTKQTGEDFVKEKTKPTEKIKPKVSINYEILSDIKTNYDIETTRDLKKRNYIKNFNIGLETKRSQRVRLNYEPDFLRFINFSSKYETNYGQERKENTKDDTLTISYDVANNREASAGIKLRFDEWGQKIIDFTRIKESEKEVNHQKEKEEREEERKKEEKKEKVKEEKEKEQEKFKMKRIEISDDSTKTDTVMGDLQKQLEDLRAKDEKEKKEIKEEKTDETPQIETEPQKPKIPIFKKVTAISGKILGFGVKLFGSTNINYSNKRNTKYRVNPDSLPKVNYQLGFSDFKNGTLTSSGQTDEFSISTRSNFRILTHLTSDLSSSYSQTLKVSSGTKSKSIQTNLPKITLSYTAIDDLIPSEITDNSKLTSTFSRTVSYAGTGFWKEPEETSIQYQLNPLISFSTRLFDKLNASISGSYSHAQNKHSKTTNVKTKSSEVGIRTSLKYDFDTEKGIKLLFLKRFKIKNEVNTSLDISYSNNHKQNFNTTKNTWEDDSNTVNFKIEPRLQYRFSKDIDGGLTARYELVKDNKKGTSRATTAINFWIKFVF